MKLINLTFKRFPADTADAIYVRELSRAFSNLLGDNFLLVVGKDRSDELADIPHHNLRLQRFNRFRPMYYFFWIPFFVLFKRNWGKEIFFFSNNYFILAALIIWKKVFWFKYKICTDWHMFSGDWKDKFIANNADFHVTTTEHLRNLLNTKLKISPDKTKTVYGGVSSKYFEQNKNNKSIRHNLNLSDGSILVGYVGFFKSMGFEKGLRTMIEALSNISTKKVKMAFIGGKEEEIKEYSAYAEKQGASDRCIFVERVNSSIVLDYQKAMDVLVIPYPDELHFRDYGFPMKTYEYMASGVPIIYSDLPIIAEVLEEYGFAFNPGDPKSLAEVVEYVITNQKESEDRALKAIEKSKMLTWKNKAQEIINFLENE